MTKVFVTSCETLDFTMMIRGACHWTLYSGSPYIQWYPISFQVLRNITVPYNQRPSNCSPSFKVSDKNIPLTACCLLHSTYTTHPINLTFLQLITPLILYKKYKLLRSCVIFYTLLTEVCSAVRSVCTIDCFELTADFEHFVECWTCSQHNGEYFASSQCLDCLMMCCCI